MCKVYSKVAEEKSWVKLHPYGMNTENPVFKVEINNEETKILLFPKKNKVMFPTGSYILEAGTSLEDAVGLCVKYVVEDWRPSKSNSQKVTVYGGIEK